MTFPLALLGAALAVKGLVLLLALFFGLGGTVLWIWALIDCGKQVGTDSGHQHRQLAWLLVIALTHVLGALLYFIFGRASLTTSASASSPPLTSSAMSRAAAPPPSVSPQPTSRPKGQCPKCGGPLGADAPEGLCPRCLLQMNLGAPTQFTGEPGAKFTTSAPPPPPPVEEISKHFPQLEILECLGRGGMGVVYKARQPRLNRLVALKILAPGRQQDPQFAERFLREAQALAKLNHPNIVTVYDFGESDGLFYLLMEYVDGVTLRGLLQSGKVESAKALVIVPRICEALQYAHEQGVVHRDIKPENVLLDKQGRVKIADFGIARMLGVEGLPAHTRDRYVIGTPYYMAPEQVEHPLEVDHRADIYSLGVVFYEMLTGELPLGRFALPSQKVQLDVRLDDVVLRTLEKEPERRYQQAGQVKTDVETITGISSGGGTSIPGVSLGAPPRPPTPPPVAPAGGSDPFSPQDEPRFSRKAIIGAVWAAFAIIGCFVLMPAITQGNLPPPLPWVKLLIITSLLFSLTAPFGTTILGWMAMGDIRRSNGRIHGLWLALFDGLLFPLLALDGLVGLMCYLAAHPILDHFAQFSGNRMVFLDYHRLDFLAPAIFISLLLDLLIIWLTARAVNHSMNPTPAHPVSTGWRIFKALAVVLILGIIVAGITLLTLLFSWNTTRIPSVVRLVADQTNSSLAEPAPDVLPPAPAPAFGPTIELDLQAGSKTTSMDDFPDLNSSMISFESGRMLSLADLPATNMTFGEEAAWATQQSLDAICIRPRSYSQPVLTGKLFGSGSGARTRFLSLSKSDADTLTPAKATDLWGNADPGQLQDMPFYDGWADLPRTFLFKTRSGSFGVVEIAAILEKSTGLKIRYKLIAPTPAPDQAVSSPTPPTPPTPPIPPTPPTPLAPLTAVTNPTAIPAPPGYASSSAVPAPPGYAPIQPDRDASVAVEIAAIEKLDFDNNKLASFLNIAHRKSLSPAAQVRLVQAAYASMDFENNKMTLLQEIIRNPDFSEQARAAILTRLSSLDFENDRVTILSLLNQKAVTASASSQ